MKLTSLLLSSIIGLVACSPIKLPVNNQYRLSDFSQKTWVKNSPHASILVSLPQAAAGYQTEKMLYVKKTFGLKAFSKNAWVDAPSAMLHPLLMESLQKSNYFRAVVSTIYNEPLDYRLDTMLLKLHQNFIKKPSVVELSVKVVLTQVKNNHIVLSRIINIDVPSLVDSPYGGVIAANKATEQLTAEITKFVIKAANQ